MDPFNIAIDQSQIDDLKDRIRRTRWIKRPAPPGWVSDVDIDYLKDLADYWANEYDWRKQEAYLNSFNQYKTTINGLNLNFLHETGSGAKRIPVLLLHGWANTYAMYLKMVERIKKEHSGLDLIVPSHPGFAFSGIPETPITSEFVAEIIFFMKEYVFAIVISLLFTAALSCSENKKEQKALKEVQAVQERARETLETLRTTHDTLQAYLDEMQKEHEVFLNAEEPEVALNKEHSVVWENYQQLAEEHRNLVARFENSMEKMESLSAKIAEDSKQAIEEAKKIHAELASFSKQNADILKRKARMEEKHEEYLYSHRTDVH